MELLSLGLYPLELPQDQEKQSKKEMVEAVLRARVETTIQNAKENLFPELINTDLKDQAEFDYKLLELDGSDNKENFGANILLSLSLAACKASATQQKKPLYLYIFEISRSLGIKTEIKVSTSNDEYFKRRNAC